MMLGHQPNCGGIGVRSGDGWSDGLAKPKMPAWRPPGDGVAGSGRNGEPTRGCQASAPGCGESTTNPTRRGQAAGAARFFSCSPSAKHNRTTDSPRRAAPPRRREAPRCGDASGNAALPAAPLAAPLAALRASQGCCTEAANGDAYGDASLPSPAPWRWAMPGNCGAASHSWS